MKVMQWITRQIYLVRVWYTSRLSKPVTPRQKKPKREYEQMAGQFTTIKGLLYGLDDTFKQLRRMKPRKNSLQQAIKRFGVYIVSLSESRNDLIDSRNLDGIGVYKLPSIMSMYYPDYHDEEGMIEQFFIAIKTTRLHGVMPQEDHSYYECGLTVPFEGKYTSINYYISVNNKTYEVNAIRMPYMKCHSIIPKHGRRTSTFHTKEWYVPDLRSDAVVEQEGCSDDVVMQGLAERFIMSYNLTMLREYGINIIVKKGKDRATFTVPQDRWKYFFKDRIKAKTIHGHTKPIYHSVSAHQRVTKRVTTAVKTHYRGLRHFIWGGYEIRIVMQGRHGASQASFNINHVEEEDVKEGVKYLGMNEVSKRINELVEG